VIGDHHSPAHTAAVLDGYLHHVGGHVGGCVWCMIRPPASLRPQAGEGAIMAFRQANVQVSQVRNSLGVAGRELAGTALG
jgi:hypothetical protein